jgi:ABC-type branched-subunit amino acid transport system substrate-binding protein
LKPLPNLAKGALVLVVACMAFAQAQAPPPEGLTEIPIGYFGPADATHPLAGGMWVAAQLAVEEANRAGGYKGLPFRLLPVWSENPWGTGVTMMARQVFGDDGVWAVVGSIDGSATHLAEQIAAKAQIAIINPAGIAMQKVTGTSNAMASQGSSTRVSSVAIGNSAILQ